MLKHHAENARLRNKGVDSVIDFIKSAVPDFVKRKPRSVKIVNIINVISWIFIGKSTGINRKISALWVTAQNEFSVEHTDCLFKIIKSLFLWRQRKCEEHIEVLLPADKRKVRSSVWNKIILFEKFKSDCGKLHTHIGLNLVYIPRNKNFAESLALCRCFQKVGVTLPQ